jgi:hypothetical protein
MAATSANTMYRVRTLNKASRIFLSSMDDCETLERRGVLLKVPHFEEPYA